MKHTIIVDEITPIRATVSDLNPKSEKYMQFMVIVDCNKCYRSLAGRIVLDKKTLTVMDTSGFMFDEIIGDGKIICDDCDKRNEQEGEEEDD